MIGIYEIPFMQKALIVSLITGSFLSFLGVYIVLRRIVFVGIALSQITACGFALGFLLGVNPTFCSILFTLVGIILFSTEPATYRIPKESVIGILYALASSLGIIFIAKSPQAERYILELLSGNVLTVTSFELLSVFVIFSLAIALHYLFYKQFIFISFDPETAATSGLNVKFWNFIFYLILGVVISFGIKTSGVVLTFSYMVIPAVAALLVARNIKKTFLLSTIFGILSAFFGLYLSFIFDLPTGPTIVAVLCIILFLVWVFKKVV